MSDDLRKTIYANFSHHDTKDLLEIWRAHDRYEWSEQTFDVIREILQERHVALPPQCAPVYAEHKLRPAATRERQKERQVEPLEGEPVSRVYETKDANPSRPTTVICAVYTAAGALAIALALSVVNLATGQFRTLTTHPWLAAIFALIAIGFLVLETFLIYGTWLGGDVSRILYIGLSLLSVISGLTSRDWMGGSTQPPLRTGLSIAVMCMDLAAVILLVLPVSNAWFREIRVAKASQKQIATQLKKRKPQSRSHTRLSEPSPDRRVRHYTFGTLVVSFVFSLLVSWLVYNLVLWLQKPGYPFDPFPNIMYAMLCLPVQAIALLFGAMIGARSARTEETRWRQAISGVWIVGAAAILLAIIGAGTLPRSGS
jgi:hypothetical protein